VNLHRLKHSRICATGSHRVHQIALGEYRGLTGNDVSRRNGQGDAQLLEGLAAKHLAQERCHLVIAEESEAGEGPAGKIFEADNRGYLFQFLGAYTAGISCADHRSNAGAGNEVDRNLFFFQNLKYANVRQSAGKASAQRYADLWGLGRFRRRLLDSVT